MFIGTLRHLLVNASLSVLGLMISVWGAGAQRAPISQLTSCARACHSLLQVQSYKRKIRQLEDDLLFRLSNSQGNLLDDTELIDILAVTKQTAQVDEKGMDQWWRKGVASPPLIHVNC